MSVWHLPGTLVYSRLAVTVAWPCLVSSHVSSVCQDFSQGQSPAVLAGSHRSVCRPVCQAPLPGHLGLCPPFHGCAATWVCTFIDPCLHLGNQSLWPRAVSPPICVFLTCAPMKSECWEVTVLCSNSLASCCHEGVALGHVVAEAARPREKQDGGRPSPGLPDRSSGSAVLHRPACYGLTVSHGPQGCSPSQAAPGPSSQGFHSKQTPLDGLSGISVLHKDLGPSCNLT